ncbi:MAG: LLM class F420-dependent oxidoreductase [Gammaproteobacteria bacterium]|nr:MAG: LLM class F420-dependent oxidoreductase [Gammaproteobacteria bacterium]
MQFGVVFPHNEIGTDPGAIRAFAQGVEALGATHLLIYDHVLGADPDRPGGWKGPYDKDVSFHEPLTTLAYLAAVTETLELVTTVLILPQRQTVLVAKQAAQVAILSGNRLRLGVGTGWNRIEYQALGVPFEQRGARQTEQVELMRMLWREDTLSYDGRFHRIDAASILPRPSQPVPIWFGGSAPALLKRCGELGDGWMPLMGANDSARACIETLRSHREAVGRSMEDFGIQAQAQFQGGTPERWASHAEKWQALGCTHLAIATQNAGRTDVDGHLARVKDYFDVVR